MAETETQFINIQTDFGFKEVFGQEKNGKTVKQNLKKFCF